VLDAAVGNQLVFPFRRMSRRKHIISVTPHKRPDARHLLCLPGVSKIAPRQNLDAAEAHGAKKGIYMKECKPEPKILSSRLDTYGLANGEKQLVDITLEANQQLVLSMQDPQTQKYMVTLRPQSPYDLKKWVGIPDHAVRSGPQTLYDETRSASQVNGAACRVFVPQLQVIPGDPEMQTNPGISHKRRERWFYNAKSIAVVITFFAAFAPFAWALNTSAQSQRTTPKPIQDHKRPPSRHMPPPDKNERQSPGPVRELGAAVSHRTIDGNGICSDQYPMYSAGNWQYAIFSICTYVVSRQTLHLTVVVREAQYNWGSAWYYNKYPMNIVGLEVQLNLPGQSPILWTPPNSDPGSGKEFNFNYKVGLDCSGTYTVKINKGSLEGMYWKGTEWAVPLSPSMQTTQPNGPPGQDSLNKIWSAMRESFTAPLAYQFGENFQIPAKYGSSSNVCSLNQPGTLLVVQHFSSLSGNGRGRLKPYLLGDTHTGPAKRCEMNSNAVTADGTKEIAEIFTPVGAWGRLGEPDFAINANYFDVRDQNGTTWLQTLCSVPLGVYYDNDPAGATGGTHNASPNKYLAGPGYFVDKAGTKAPEDTLFWIHSITNGPMTNPFTITLSRTADADAASRQAKILEDGGYTFVAFSGTALIPTHFPGAAPDSGSVPTTRIGIGYDQGKDVLYIFEGGSYQNGVNRSDLAGIFEALGATTALEVDGGGSASLVIKDGSAVWGGQAHGTQPVTSCPNSGAWCSPITQPDGKSRPVPSWLGMNFNNGADRDQFWRGALFRFAEGQFVRRRAFRPS
jgi:hypothetical protein